MKLKLFTFLTGGSSHNDEETRRSVNRQREEEARDAIRLNHLRRSEAMDNLFATMRTPPQEQR